MYCGDETGAVVVDIGQGTSRLGYAGLDLPACCFTSATAVTAAETAESAGAAAGSAAAAAGSAAGSAAGAGSSAASKWRVGDSFFSGLRKGADVRYPVKDGYINDWEALERVYAYGLEEQLRVNPAEHPLLVCDGSFSRQQQPHREKLVEVLMETFHCPALYLGRNPVLSSFSCGKSTALIVDLSAGGTTVTPVYDGIVLQRDGKFRSSLGGDRLNVEALKMVEAAGHPTRPRYTFNKKRLDGGPWEVTDVDCTGVTESYTTFLRETLGREMKESLATVSPVPLRYVSVAAAAATEADKYELPDGTVITANTIKYKLPELLFDPTPITTPFHPLTPLSTMVHECLKSVEADIRKDLCSNVILVGGGSAMPGVAKRLTNELASLVPLAYKVRVLSSESLDKTFAPFVGGSILASLGTFQQLWISKEEYADEGPGAVERRCP